MFVSFYIGVALLPICWTLRSSGSDNFSRPFVLARHVVPRIVSRGPQPVPRRTVVRRDVAVVRRPRSVPVVRARVRQARIKRAQLLQAGRAGNGVQHRAFLRGHLLFDRFRLVGHRAQAERGPRAQESVRPEGCHAQGVLYATAKSTFFSNFIVYRKPYSETGLANLAHSCSWSGPVNMIFFCRKINII